jgi:hypothetical protein
MILSFQVFQVFVLLDRPAFQFKLIGPLGLDLAFFL